MEKETARPRAGVKSATAFRTISEVSDELDVPQHVLRFWETKFPQVRPLKRGGGRRYYRPEDVALLRRIQRLLYSEGYTIKGVQRLLKDSRSTGVEADVEVEIEGDIPGDIQGEGIAEDQPEALVEEEEDEEEAQPPLPPVVTSPPPPVFPAATPAPTPTPAPTQPPIPAPPLSAEAISPPTSGLSAWHRRELVGVRAELLELRTLLRKAVR